MLKRKSKYILIAAVIASTILSSTFVMAKEITKETSDTNKSWSIKFNQDVDFNGDVKNAITVIDSKGNILVTNIRLGDSKTIIIDAPKEGYKSGESYTINISNKLHSIKNVQLKENVQCNFTITGAKDAYGEQVDNALKLGINKISQEGVGDDWQALVLSRYGQQVPASYVSNLESNLKASSGIMNQPTDYERTTIALMAVEKDPTNFVGYNLVEKIYNCNDMENQGINAYIFALIALDSGKFSVPENAAWTREKLINKILDYRTEDKGWSYGGDTADPDMTGMAITALAPYKDRSDVKAAIDEAIDRLSAIQNEDGSFSSWGTVNSESCSQVVIALCSNGIDPTGDKFTKSKNALDALLQCQVEGGGFYHTKETGYNTMGTEQALEALEAYKMLKAGKGSLYIFK
ncbi:prenyltransferase/squalene oxidase repeat-containing protein [Clostridium thailandense]|uniref:prenyltransferase/squalene oxidase repeat-containing protein n=1 Tax=Clostridium thailandense TaxID=2794346 RepID=UPI00398A3976